MDPLWTAASPLMAWGIRPTCWRFLAVTRPHPRCPQGQDHFPPSPHPLPSWSSCGLPPPASPPLTVHRAPLHSGSPRMSSINSGRGSHVPWLLVGSASGREERSGHWSWLPPCTAPVRCSLPLAQVLSWVCSGSCSCVASPRTPHHSLGLPHPAHASANVHFHSSLLKLLSLRARTLTHKTCYTATRITVLKNKVHPATSLLKNLLQNSVTYRASSNSLGCCGGCLTI